MTFHDAIYSNRDQVKQYSLIKDSCCWPETVSVLDEDYPINGAYCDIETNEPASIFGWVEYQFRCMHSCPLPMLNQCLRIWWGIYEQVNQYFIDKEWYADDWQASQRLAFNVTWALLGYNDENQDISAVQLAAELMADPESLFQKYRRLIPNYDGSLPTPPPPKPKPPYRPKAVTKMTGTFYAKKEAIIEPTIETVNTPASNGAVPKRSYIPACQPKRPVRTQRPV